MKIIKRIRRIFWSLVFNNAKLSFSQSGEDMILATIFCNISKGFYLDVGANNPFVQSNTYYFYIKGWHGVNIDALPGSMKYFNKTRPKDINVEAAISDDVTELNYYMFSSSFYNTFHNTEIEKNTAFTQFIGEKKIETIKLSEILDTLNLPDIDFMTVDVEGMDLNVLKSNNWGKYRPKVILTEYNSKSLDLLYEDEVYIFLKDKGYRFLCNTITNIFYIENNFYKVRFSNH